MQINVLEYFEKGAALKCGDKVAVVEHERQFTFKEIERFAKNCAALILRRTAAGRQPIPVFLPKSAQNIVADLGILYSGNAYANLDVKSPQQRLKGMLDNLNPGVIITSAAHAATLLALGIAGEKLLYVEQAMVPEAIYDNAVLLRRLDAIIDTDPYCFIHTSGSTGIPKGVALNHRSTIDFVDWAFERLGLDGSEVMGSLAPIYFDAYTLEFCMMHCQGCHMGGDSRPMRHLPGQVGRIFGGAAHQFYFLGADHHGEHRQPGFAGESEGWTASKRFFSSARFSPPSISITGAGICPDAMFVNLYGPIEITVACTYFIVDREMADDDKLPVGFPCRNTEILILNDQNQAAKVDEPGEICVRGSSLALGYWNNAERTAKGFVQNPLNPHYPELIYRTGDSGYWNSRGEIMFLGRKDFQIKHLGYRIELGEIEHAVARRWMASAIAAWFTTRTKGRSRCFTNATRS